MAEYSTLQDLIVSLEQGTNLCISVLFFVPVAKPLQTDFSHVIHSSPFCNSAKERPRGLIRCMRCKKWATEKAIRTGMPFGGYCIHGVYEYCIPVVIDGTAVCVVFAGNLVLDGEFFVKKNIPWPVDSYLNTVERSLSAEDCARAARVVESYIRMLYAQFPSPTTEKTGYLVRRLQEYADAHFLYEINLPQMAELFHYNEKYLGRVFKGETGMSFRQYVNEKRLRYARKLLRTTPSDILDIALSCGFGTVPYFNRLFKSRYGITPSEYRKSMR